MMKSAALLIAVVCLAACAHGDPAAPSRLTDPGNAALLLPSDLGGPACTGTHPTGHSVASAGALRFG